MSKRPAQRTSSDRRAPAFAGGLTIEQRPTGSIKPYEKNPRVNDAAVEKVADSIREFGFRQPIVIDVAGVIVCGHTRWLAAKQLGLQTVPCHVALDLTPAQLRAYRLADNKTGELSDWDPVRLVDELAAVQAEGIDATLLGWTDDELTALLEPRDVRLIDREVREPPTMTWVLIGIPTVRYSEIAGEVERIAAAPDVLCEVCANSEAELGQCSEDRQR
ncbi:MAG: ParB N-terminal domain-containing protein [Phycisphaerae bacterium]|jgi:hypothetical protein